MKNLQGIVTSVATFQRPLDVPTPAVVAAGAADLPVANPSLEPSGVRPEQGAPRVRRELTPEKVQRRYEKTLRSLHPTKEQRTKMQDDTKIITDSLEVGEETLRYPQGLVRITNRKSVTRR